MSQTGSTPPSGGESGAPAPPPGAVPAPPPQQPPPGYYGPPPAYGFQYGPPPVVVKTNGFAIASMVLGIIWIYGLTSILAIIFGHVALSQINQAGGWQRGRGMAIAGLILGYIGIALLILLIIVAAVDSSDSTSIGRLTP